VIGTMTNLDEKPLALVPNPKNIIFNLHLRPSFVELSKTHDQVLKHQAVVHTMEYLVLAVLCLKDDGANA